MLFFGGRTMKTKKFVTEIYWLFAYMTVWVAAPNDGADGYSIQLTKRDRYSLITYVPFQIRPPP